MRLLALIVGLPLASLFTWWGFASAARHNQAGTTDTFVASRRTFQVTLQEKGELKAANSIDIKCELEGRSTIISLVPEGSYVKKGDLLIELASDEVEERVQSQKIQVTSAQANLESTKQQFDILLNQNKSNIDKAELKLELADLELKKYTEGEWPQQLQDAEFRVEEAEKVLKREQADLEAARKLVKKEYITRTEFEEDEFNFYKAEVSLQKAKRDLEILEQYTHIKDQQQKLSDNEEAKKELERVIKKAQAQENEQRANLEARQAETKLKEQRLAKLEEQMKKTKIYAPADGLVVYGDGNSQRWYRGSENQIKEGAQVRERQTLMQLPDTSKMKVVVRIHEAQTNKVSLGQKAIVTVEGINDQQSMGTITKIAVLADSQNRWLNPELKEYETDILLDGTHELLKPGVTARVEILIAELQDVLAIPIQSVFSKGPKSFVFVDDVGKSEPREVQIGLSSTEFVEVKSGLSEGEEVLLMVSDELKHLLPDIKARPEQLAKTKKNSSSSGKNQARRRSGQKPTETRGSRRQHKRSTG